MRTPLLARSLPKRWLRRLTIALACQAGLVGAAPPDGLKLHVPSPDWRDQVIYFALTDRFDDGDPSNNDQGAGEYNPRSVAHYSGGDFKGLMRRIDYIRGLGATALWITPPAANQWWDAGAQYGGYHGYWAQDFMSVDRHLGTLADYQQLSHQLHSAGLYLVQDIVVNHTGNYFSYDGSWSPRQPAQGYQINLQSRPTQAPTQAPFNLNDPRVPAQRAAGIYHWTPDVRDFKNPQQVLNWQMSGLDDLNTENPTVRRALRQSYGHWVREVGVDAFRVDTALYVPPGFFADFLKSRDPKAPGIEQVARQTGRRSFYSFGEGFAIDKPFSDTESRRIERYVRTPQGQPLMTGMLNFPLYGALGDVMGRGAPTAQLADRITRMMRVHSQPHLMATFVDNHDVDRFLAGGNQAGLRQALLAMMTLPGVPVIYYGTEQGFTEQRGAMFAGGYASGGRDHFDTQSPLYRDIARMTTLRREHRLFSRGRPTLLQSNPIGPGVIVWRMDGATPTGTESALVALNTSDEAALMHGVPSGLPAGTALVGLFSLQGDVQPLQTGSGGLLQAELPARSGQVWRLPAPARSAAAPATAREQAPLAITRSQLSADGNRLRVRGQGPAGSTLRLVIDGQLGRAQAVQADAQGRFEADLDTATLAETSTPHSLVAWAPALQMASAATPLPLRRSWQMLADVADPAGDDTGPDGRYTYPTDEGWGHRHQMDLRRARVWQAGGALRIELTVPTITQGWGPPNGFDRVAFTLFFSQAGRDDGATVLPQQNASLPEGRRWQHRLRVHGWSNALFSAQGASANDEGTALTAGVQVQADAKAGTVRLTLPAGALGGPEALRGLQVYVTTWDYDGGYRPLAPQAGGHVMGGGPADGPKVMDDLWIRLP